MAMRNTNPPSCDSAWYAVVGIFVVARLGRAVRDFATTGHNRRWQPLGVPTSCSNIVTCSCSSAVGGGSTVGRVVVVVVVVEDMVNSNRTGISVWYGMVWYR
jgi:hypothetical protein